MCRILLASALALAACQPGDPANENQAELAANGAAAPMTNVSAAADGMVLPIRDPDTPVSSDDPPGPQPPPAAFIRDCEVVRSSGWTAHVDAMPGPNTNPRLIVSGKVTVPTGGFRLALRMGPVAESYPVQVTVILDVTPPSGMASQALVTHNVRGNWPSEQRVGAVTIRCGSRALARLGNIETAH